MLRACPPLLRTSGPDARARRGLAAAFLGLACTAFPAAAATVAFEGEVLSLRLAPREAGRGLTGPMVADVRADRVLMGSVPPLVEILVDPACPLSVGRARVVADRLPGGAGLRHLCFDGGLDLGALGASRAEIDAARFRLEANPDDHGAYRALSALYRAAGDHERDAALWADAVYAGMGAEADRERGIALTASGREDEGAMLLARAASAGDAVSVAMMTGAPGGAVAAPVQSALRTLGPGARLEGADLRGIDLARLDLKGATYDCATRFPEGFGVEAAGMVGTGTGCPDTAFRAEGKAGPGRE